MEVTWTAAMEVVTMMRPERRGFMCRAAAARHRAVEVYFDDSVPAVSRVVLDGEVRWPLCVIRSVHKPGTGIDARVGEQYIEAPIELRCFGKRCIYSCTITNVYQRAAYSITRGLQPCYFTPHPVRI